MKRVLPVFFLLLLVSSLEAQDFEKLDPGNPICKISTSMGDIYIELFAKDAPKTVANFLGLAEGTKEFTDQSTGQKMKRPFYDGLVFHRVIKNFMIQGGCPQGSGQGGPGYKFEDEISAKSLGLDTQKAFENNKPHPLLGIRSQEQFQQMLVGPIARQLGIKDQAEFQARVEEVKKRLDALTVADAYTNLGYRFDNSLRSHKPTKGVLAMANAGPNTNGSQFFLNLADTPWLTGKHTVFGRVVGGMDVVEKIGEVEVSSGDSRPTKEIKIHTIRRMP